MQELEHSASQGHQEDPASLRLDHRAYGHPGLQWVQGSARAVPRGGQGSAPGDQQTAFRQRFYRKEGPHREVPFDGAEDEIKQLIGDITWR